MPQNQNQFFFINSTPVHQAFLKLNLMTGINKRVKVTILDF